MYRSLLIILLAQISLSLHLSAQNFRKAEYTVNNIITRKEYYLIFLTSNENKYTLYSPTSINVVGCKMHKDSSYVLNLKIQEDTLANGKNINPVNYKDVLYFDNYTKDEIGKLCTSSDVMGLIILGKPCIAPR